MRLSYSALFAILAGILGVARPAIAQQGSGCWVTAPPGTVAACGNAPGYYRQQPYTLSPQFVPQSANGEMYAPYGPNQQYWRQYTPQTQQYGPQEPNPFAPNGQLSIPRAVNHVMQTRIIPGAGREVQRAGGR